MAERIWDAVVLWARGLFVIAFVIGSALYALPPVCSAVQNCLLDTAPPDRDTAASKWLLAGPALHAVCYEGALRERADVRWEQVGPPRRLDWEHRLQQVGACDWSWGESRDNVQGSAEYQLACEVPLGKGSTYRRRFEARDASYEGAVDRVLAQIAAWREAGGGSPATADYRDNSAD